jgi:PTS system ascorbate-specific IIA component
MPSILVVAHAPLASSLMAVARHVYPECSHTAAAVDVAPGATPEAVQLQIRAALGGLGAEEVLLLVDVFGATPCNAALAVADGQRSRVVAGVNVPMLWRTLCYAHMPLEDLVTRALAGASQGVMHVAVPRRQNQSSSPSHHDQVQHHHQQ